MRLLMYMYTNHKLYTHHEQDAEVGQFSKEILHADRVGVKGKKAAYALVELLHVLVHRGQFFILLPGMLAEAVKKDRVKEKGEKHVSNTDKTYLKATLISDIMTLHKYVYL